MNPDPLTSKSDEEAVVGILLGNIDPPQSLTREHIYDAHLQTLFDAMAELRKEGRPVETINVVNLLKSRGALDAGGGPFYADQIYEKAPIAQVLDYHVGRLELHRRRRAYNMAALRIQAAAADIGVDDGELLDAQCAGIMADMMGPGNSMAVLDAAEWLKVSIPDPSQVLRGAFDLNTKTCITGPSKARKSFFALQSSVALASGSREFLSWHIDHPRIVLYVNMEIPEAHFHKRLKRMVTALAVDPEGLGKRLFIMNCRGISGDTVLTRIVTESKRVKADVVVLDPIYKLVPGDESKQENVKALLSTMDRLCASTGAALVYVHHGTKGESGDRQAIDRAAGSGVLARDVDCLISLVNHIDDGLLVVEQIARSYAPKDSFVIRWDMEADCFKMEDGAIPVVRTSFNRGKGVGKSVSDQDAVSLVEDKPLTSAMFIDALRKTGIGKEPARRIMDRLVDTGELQMFKAKTFPTRTFVGTASGIKRLKHDLENPSLS
jgi:hypothetical protein